MEEARWGKVWLEEKPRARLSRASQSQLRLFQSSSYKEWWMLRILNWQQFTFGKITLALHGERRRREAEEVKWGHPIGNYLPPGTLRTILGSQS